MEHDLPKTCPKCGGKEGWAGPFYHADAQSGQDEKLKFKCGQCGYAVYLPCVDAK